MERIPQNLNLGVEKGAQTLLQDFIKELLERLEKMEETIVIDRIEGNIAVCENRKNKKMQNISLTQLPKEVAEGSILKWKNGKYELEESNEIEKRIEQKMKDVWN